MFQSVLCADIEGISARKVYVEADVTGGLPAFNMVGLLSSEVREARERVERALANSGFDIPARKITINMSPASLRKNGTGFDVAIALSVLSCLGLVKKEALEGRMFVGELSLDGSINRINGVLPIAILAKEEGIRALVVPAANVFEGAAIREVDICGADNLRSLVEQLNTDSLEKAEPVDLESLLDRAFEETPVDYRDINGQERAKRATLIAVAGFHNLMYIGPPGSGKSMLASRIPTILNRLSVEESLEISGIYSVIGKLKEGHLVLTRPFRVPHHSITSAALIGGTAQPRPGEITLAHKGILFLDEAAEFRKENIELLRQPLEDKKILISRAFNQIEFPADFMLVMAMNPCKCGYYPDRNLCRCTQTDVDRYLGKVRGPVLDRVDICVGTRKLEVTELKTNEMFYTSDQMRACVLKAQEIQKQRFAGRKIDFNSQMTKKEIEEFCVPDEEGRFLLDKAYKTLPMTARGYYKILKVARTVADVDGVEIIGKKQILEAVGYRNHSFDR